MNIGYKACELYYKQLLFLTFSLAKIIEPVPALMPYHVLSEIDDNIWRANPCMYCMYLCSSFLYFNTKINVSKELTLKII